MRRGWLEDWRRDPRCTVIYNGLDLQQFSGPDDRCGVRRAFGFSGDCQLIINVGLLSSWKNQERVVRIFGELLRRRPQCRLLLVGRDANPIKARIERTIASLALQDAVVIAGERTDIPRLLKAADLMIFPSLREGLPGAVLEACAAGTPVISSDLPGAIEIAAECSLVNCVSLTAPDCEWSRAAERTLSGPRVAVDLSGGAFDVRTMARRIRELYESQAA